MKKLLALALSACLLFAFGAQAETLTGTAKGFGGDVTVTVTVEGGKITKVEAAGPDETSGIGTPALEQLPALIVAAGNAQVDVIAGATYTSEAILKAVENAMGAQAETLTGTAKGFGGDVTVTVTVEGGKITKVEAAGPDETSGIGTPALEQLPALIVAAGNAQVDVIAGATYTSEAILKAVEIALASQFKALTGVAKGFGGDVTVTVTVEDGKITKVEAVGPDETPGIGTLALEQLPALIEAAGNTQVDVIAGATYTSEAIIEAIDVAMGM